MLQNSFFNFLCEGKKGGDYRGGKGERNGIEGGDYRGGKGERMEEKEGS